MSRPKLRDIAERAGVSAMTVSLALRDVGSQRMAPETLERVRRAAEELNYSPNARARALRLGKTNVIALYAGHGFVNVRTPFFTEIVSGLQEGCEGTRRDLLLHGVFHGSSPDDLYRELADGRIDGLVVSMPAEEPLAKKLGWSWPE
ncbi:LacI family transcriptional regulator [bacterium]|nr:MAG: LacI family transcriptional regulator [bacterium]